jgi:hypothetical protein
MPLVCSIGKKNADEGLLDLIGSFQISVPTLIYYGEEGIIIMANLEK